MAVIEAIATQYLEADAASVTFSSIPATYEHLQLRWSTRGVTTSFHSPDVYVRFNSDTGGNYSTHYMSGSATNISAPVATGATSMNWGGASGSYGSSQAAAYGSLVADILDYANTNKNTTVQFPAGVINAETSVIRFGSGLWDDTSAVSQIDLLLAHDNWTRGSEFTLYGLNSS